FRRHADGLAAPRRFLSNRLSLGRRLGPELARTDARDDHAVLGPDRGSAAAEIAEFYPATLGRADAPAGRAPHLSRLCRTIGLNGRSSSAESRHLTPNDPGQATKLSYATSVGRGSVSRPAGTVPVPQVAPCCRPGPF